MSETPEERRERIDNARREQAVLLRQIGQEHSGIVVRPSAGEAWRRLLEVLNRGRSRCFGRHREYTDYDAFNVPSPGRAAMMCTGCPMLKECNDYATIAKPGWGVYGGRVYGKDLAAVERREIIAEGKKKLKGVQK